MSLCFTIRTKESNRFEGLRQGYPYVIIDPEYYEALLPCFELIKQKTGKLIDLYDWEEFTGNELEIVAEAFKAKKKELDEASSPVVVNIGRQRNPDGSEVDLIFSLSPPKIALLLQRSLDLIGVAKVDGKVFVCKGD